MDLGWGLGRGRVLDAGLNLSPGRGPGRGQGLGQRRDQGAINERCNYEKRIRLGEISIGVQIWAAGVVQGTVPVNEAHSVRVGGSVGVMALVEV